MRTICNRVLPPRTSLFLSCRPSIQERLLGPACWMWGEAGLGGFYCLYLYDMHDQTAVFVLFTPTPSLDSCSHFVYHMVDPTVPQSRRLFTVCAVWPSQPRIGKPQAIVLVAITSHKQQQQQFPRRL